MILIYLGVIVISAIAVKQMLQKGISGIKNKQMQIYIHSHIGKARIVKGNLAIFYGILYISTSLIIISLSAFLFWIIFIKP